MGASDATPPWAVLPPRSLRVGSNCLSQLPWFMPLPVALVDAIRTDLGHWQIRVHRA